MASDDGGPEAGESLPPSARYVLAELQEADAPLTLSDLDAALHHRRSTIEWAVRRLKDSGYIRVDQNPADLREIAVTLRDERTVNTSESDTSA